MQNKPLILPVECEFAMAYTTVDCECGAKVTPSLLHCDGGFLRHRLTEHICPVCGVVMYTTGGEVYQSVRPLAARLVPAGLFLYAYFCAKTGNWGNGLVLAGIASATVCYNFPALARKAFHIGTGFILPLLFLWMATGMPSTGSGWEWFALLFFGLAAVTAFFSHRALACQLARRVLVNFRGHLKESA